MLVFLPLNNTWCVLESTGRSLPSLWISREYLHKRMQLCLKHLSPVWLTCSLRESYINKASRKKTRNLKSGAWSPVVPCDGLTSFQVWSLIFLSLRKQASCHCLLAPKFSQEVINTATALPGIIYS